MKDTRTLKEGDFVTTKDVPALSKRVAKHEDVLYFMENTVGKVLTIVDAVSMDRDQAKAVKTLVKDAMWGNFRTFQDWYLNQENGYGSSFPFKKTTIETI